MAKKESKLKQAARGATAPFKNVGRDTRRMLGRGATPQAVPAPPAMAGPPQLAIPSDVPPVDMADWDLINRITSSGASLSPIHSPLAEPDLAALMNVPTPPTLGPRQVPPGTGFGHAFDVAAQALSIPQPETMPAGRLPMWQGDAGMIPSLTGVSADDDITRRIALIQQESPGISHEQAFKMAQNMQNRSGIGRGMYAGGPSAAPASAASQSMVAPPPPSSFAPRTPGGVRPAGPMSMDEYRTYLETNELPAGYDPNIRGGSRADAALAAADAYRASAHASAPVANPLSDAEMMSVPAPSRLPWNTGSPDTRDLSRIPMPPERIPGSVQALDPTALAELKGRLPGEMRLSGSPLQNEAGYQDLLSAARAKLAGQDVPVPTVIGSDRYRGGTEQAQQMMRDSWANARAARAGRAADQANRMQNDPLTQYRAARAGNPMAGMQMQLDALGGANTPAAMLAMGGPGFAAAGMEAQGRQAAIAADLEKARLENDTVMKATLAPQIMARAAEYVKQGMDPVAAQNQATTEVVAAAQQQQLPVPPPPPTDNRTIVGRAGSAIGDLGDWMMRAGVEGGHLLRRFGVGSR